MRVAHVIEQHKVFKKTEAYSMSTAQLAKIRNIQQQEARLRLQARLRGRLPKVAPKAR